MSNILIAKEKHGDFYYPAGDDEELAKSALQILTDRWNEGYWYSDPDQMDAETEQWRPEELIWNVIGDSWPGWDVPKNERVVAINAYSESLKEKYGDDPEILALKSKKLNRAIQEYRYREDYRKWYKEAKEVVENRDWQSVVTFKSGRTEPRAWHLLSERSDHQYEGVELEQLQTVKVGNNA